MSYILEALKRSEQERQQGHVPDLQTVHTPVTNEPAQSYWPYIVIALLLLSLLFILGWMRPWERSASSEQVAPVESVDVPIASPSSRQVQQTRAPAAIKPEQEAVAVVSDHRPLQTSHAVEPPLDNATIVNLDEMPALIQQAIPELNFAGHVYSSNPQQRSVIINGASMSEGDRIIDGLILREINQKGVVLSYQGQLFRIEVLQDWSFD